MVWTTTLYHTRSTYTGQSFTSAVRYSTGACAWKYDDAARARRLTFVRTSLSAALPRPRVRYKMRYKIGVGRSTTGSARPSVTHKRTCGAVIAKTTSTEIPAGYMAAVAPVVASRR